MTFVDTGFIWLVIAYNVLFFSFKVMIKLDIDAVYIEHCNPEMKEQKPAESFFVAVVFVYWILILNLRISFETNYDHDNQIDFYKIPDPNFFYRFSIPRYLCDRVVPGNRVTVMGIYSIKKVAQIKAKSHDKGAGVGIRAAYLRVVGLEVDTEGAGGGTSVFWFKMSSLFSHSHVLLLVFQAVEPLV